AIQLLGTRDPFPDDHLDVRQRLLIRRPIRCAAWQLRDLGKERLISVAPIQDNLVLDVIHVLLPPSQSDLPPRRTYLLTGTIPPRAPLQDHTRSVRRGSA